MKSYLTIVVCAGILQGCVGPESAFGFRLPAGDEEAGRRAFGSLQCNACHSITGVEAPAESAIDVTVTLGGDVSRVKTYGELVTAIINPSHKLAPGYRDEDVSADGESLMASTHLNQVMTVQELIDIVAYLQPLYEVRPPEHNPYAYIYQ
jgi:hypothetical protein